MCDNHIYINCHTLALRKTHSVLIDAELAKEAEQQVKLMVNMRFGSRTWDRIVAERSRRVKAAEKRLKAQKIRRQEQIETALAVGFLLTCVAAICGFMAWYYLKT